MKLFKLMAITVLGLAVAGCASVETVTRNAPIETSSFGGAQSRVIARNYAVQDMTFAASTQLRVSESNSFYPNADVVWRGDPIGNRIEQIAAMFKTALDRNVDKMDGLVPVVVDYRSVRTGRYCGPDAGSARPDREGPCHRFPDAGVCGRIVGHIRDIIFRR